jgi:hypothetical protein
MLENNIPGRTGESRRKYMYEYTGLHRVNTLFTLTFWLYPSVYDYEIYIEGECYRTC